MDDKIKEMILNGLDRFETAAIAKGGIPGIDVIRMDEPGLQGVVDAVILSAALTHLRAPRDVMKPAWCLVVIMARQRGMTTTDLASVITHCTDKEDRPLTHEILAEIALDAASANGIQ